METKKGEALKLAEELLSDIELGRLEPIDIARRASRLARLCDDLDASLWLYHEVAGYPEGVALSPMAWNAAKRSNRIYTKDKKEYAHISGLGRLHASIESAGMQLAAAVDAPRQISSANPNQHVFAPAGNYLERSNLRKELIENQAVLDKVIGAIHIYVTATYQELRFGAAVETAFENIRNRVDSSISSLIPDGLPILTTALENAGGANPIQWGNAAKACRDLIKAAADALRPPGKPKNGRPMADGNYINRLVDWIETNIESETMADMVKSDLSDLGNRLDAATGSGNKGTHAKVTKEEASRYIVGTYMLLGDILGLQRSTPVDGQAAENSSATASDESVAPEVSASEVAIASQDTPEESSVKPNKTPTRTQNAKKPAKA